MSEIASRVKAIIVDKLGVEESEVTTEASFTNDLGADSLDTVEPVSYTHLDVYKRQLRHKSECYSFSHQSFKFFWQIIQPSGKLLFRQPYNCLLYTSRCV